METIVAEEELSVAGFERRIAEMGGTVRPGSRPGERTATYIIPGKPGYFPPREVTVVYDVAFAFEM
jgi:hypothetical protein